MRLASRSPRPCPGQRQAFNSPQPPDQSDPQHPPSSHPFGCQKVGSESPRTILDAPNGCYSRGVGRESKRHGPKPVDERIKDDGGYVSRLLARLRRPRAARSPAQEPATDPSFSAVPQPEESVAKLVQQVDLLAKELAQLQERVRHLEESQRPLVAAPVDLDRLVRRRVLAERIRQLASELARPRQQQT